MDTTVDSYTIKQVSLQVLNDFFTKDPKLSFMGLSDQAMDYLYHTGSITISQGALLYGVYDEDKLVCCIELEPWNEICSTVHMYLSSELHRTGAIRKIKDSMIQYCKENMTYNKILLYVPAVCTQVIVAAEAFGLKREAVVTDCLLWRQKVTDMIIFGLDIKRE